MNESLHSYLQSNLGEKPKHIQDMEAYASRHHVPIMEPLGIELLMQMIRLQKPKRILEIGTAIGYSAIRMAEAFPECNIVTIERDEDRYEEAIKNIEKVGLQDRIEVIKGDALEVFDTLKEKAPFDLLFIDAAKGQYEKFFTMYVKLLTTEGVIISDNVLFKGLVAKEVTTDNKRLQKIADKIRTYNDWLINQEDYHTTIVPVGDGIAITVKR
jgi:predicted O-methyltransferase YrrM